MSTTTTSLSSDRTTGDPSAAFADLIERLEKVTGPDRKLDADMAIACGALPIINTTWMGGHIRALDAKLWTSEQSGYLRHPDYEYGCRTPEFTSSVDAALTLVPEGSAWTLGQNVHHRHWQACVNALNPDGEPYAVGFSGHTEMKSPAIALCFAALKARAAIASARVTAQSPATTTELA